MQIPSAQCNQLPEETVQQIVQKITLQDTFNKLESQYYQVCREANRYGVLAQATADSFYNLLSDFVAEHPDFKLPGRMIVKGLA